jgi:hypothetical protein
VTLSQPDPGDVDRLADALDEAAAGSQLAAVALAGDLLADTLDVLARTLEHAGAKGPGLEVRAAAGRVAGALARVLAAVEQPNAAAALAQGSLL